MSHAAPMSSKVSEISSRSVSIPFRSFSCCWVHTRLMKSAMSCLSCVTHSDSIWSLFSTNCFSSALPRAAFCDSSTIVASFAMMPSFSLSCSSRSIVSFSLEPRRCWFSISSCSMRSCRFSSSSKFTPPLPSFSCKDSILASSSAIFASFGSRFLTGLFSICFARSAKRSVEMVSLTLRSEGPQLANMTVLLLPPRESLSSFVSGDERYGTCFAPFTMVSMTVASDDRLRLMLHPSLSVSPAAPVFVWRSDPARSTMLILDDITTGAVASCSKSYCSTVMTKRECEREDDSLSDVEAVWRRSVPSRK
eukprot:PhM_4_TR11528/c0_g1_i1/m.92882